MTETSSPPLLRPGVPVRDPWPGARPFRYDGWLERNGFAPAWTALAVLVLAWVAFQLIGGLVGGIWIGVALATEGGGTTPSAGEVADLVGRYPGAMIVANTAGQVLGLGLIGWLAARWTARTGTGAFLRMRRPQVRGAALAVGGWLALLPLLFWSAELNALLPLPEWLKDLEALQTDLLQALLVDGAIGVGWLVLALAVTPALFEEVLFRGYLQRQVERRWGVVASVVLVGVLFGFFHMRLTQVVPLALLGVYLGYAVWATGSLWTGTLVHLLHNGTVIVALDAARRAGVLEAPAMAEASVPWWAALLGLTVAAPVLLALRRHRARATGGWHDGDLSLDGLAPSPALDADAVVPAGG